MQQPPAPSLPEQIASVLIPVFTWTAGILGIVFLLYLAFFLVAGPIVALRRKGTALKVLSGYLYVAPVLFSALLAGFFIFLVQAAVIYGMYREATNPGAALTRALRSRLEAGSPRLLEEARGRLAKEPLHVADLLFRNIRRFAESAYYPPTQWSIRALHAAVRFYDAAFLLVMLVAMALSLGPVAVDTLAHPLRRARSGETAGTMLRNVGKRLLGMLAFLVLSGAVYVLYAILLGAATALLTLVAAQILADASLDTARAALDREISPFVVFLHAACFALFVFELTALLALSIFATSAGTGAAIRARIDRRLFGRAVPQGYRTLARRHSLFIGKLMLVLLVLYGMVRLAFALLPVEAALVAAAIVNVAGANAFLFLLKAHRDLKELGSTAVRLHRTPKPPSLQP